MRHHRLYSGFIQKHSACNKCIQIYTNGRGEFHASNNAWKLEMFPSKAGWVYFQLVITKKKGKYIVIHISFHQAIVPTCRWRHLFIAEMGTVQHRNVVH